MIKNYLTYIKEAKEIYPFLYAGTNYSEEVKKKLDPVLIGKKISFHYWYKGDDQYHVGQEDNVELKEIVVEIRPEEKSYFFQKPWRPIHFIVGDDNRDRVLHTNHPIVYDKGERIYLPHDPYGEEDWTTNESMDEDREYKKGDAVRVLPKLREYVASFGWEPSMLNLIGKKLTISTVFNHEDDDLLAAYFQEDLEYDWWIPLECLEPWPTMKKPKGKIQWYSKGKLKKEE